MGTTVRRTRVSVSAAVLVAGLTLAPEAQARIDLAVGMPIEIGNHRCTLGFFGFNAREDRLAVTSGHCSDQVPNEGVYAENGAKIGEVVAWKPDLENEDGKLIGARGYTVIGLYDRFSLEPYITGVSSVEKGDYVTKFGQRTGKTSGYVTSVKTVEDRPDLALVKSNMVQLPGDSGCAWVTGDRYIVGMGSSGNQERQGGDAGSQAQPIGAVIDMIRDNGSVWGDGFKVWSED